MVIYMADVHEIRITTRDKLLRAWENSMELVRDFETCSREIKDDEHAAEVLASFAVDEGVHASTFREMLLEKQEK